MNTSELAEWGLDVSSYLQVEMRKNMDGYHVYELCPRNVNGSDVLRLQAADLEEGVELCNTCWHMTTVAGTWSVRTLISSKRNLESWTKDPNLRFHAFYHSLIELDKVDQAFVPEASALQAEWVEWFENSFPGGREGGRSKIRAQCTEPGEVLVFLNMGEKGGRSVQGILRALSDPDARLAALYWEPYTPRYCIAFRGPEEALCNLALGLRFQGYLDCVVTTTPLEEGDTEDVLRTAYDLLEGEGLYADLGAALRAAREL